MMRIGNIFGKIVSMENIALAYENAAKGKRSRKEVMEIEADKDAKLEEIRDMLVSRTFTSSRYRIFEVNERGKARNVADLPFFPDRIVHWALVQVIEPTLVPTFIDQTYAAIPGRGTHGALMKLDEYIHRKDPPKYCLKTDVRKFFPSIDKDLLMDMLERRYKDRDMLWLCSEIIYGYPESGIPIGNLTSQYFANLYLSGMDHTLKEKRHVHMLLRYMDDVVILGNTKAWLHRIRRVMVSILSDIRLTMKHTWQVFPISRGIDFLGYRTFVGYRLLRQTTKLRLKRVVSAILKKLDAGRPMDVHDWGAYHSYSGILSWCNGYRLRKATLGRIDAKLAEVSA